MAIVEKLNVYTLKNLVLIAAVALTNAKNCFQFNKSKDILINCDDD